MTGLAPAELAPGPEGSARRRDVLGIDATMTRIARRLGITESQCYTLLLGLVMAVMVAFVGTPPAMNGGLSPQAAFSQPLPPGAEPLVVSGARDQVLGGQSPPDDGRPSQGSQAAPPPDTAGEAGPSFADGGPFGQVEVVVGPLDGSLLEGIAVDPRSGEFFVATNSADGSAPARVMLFSPRGQMSESYVVADQLPAAKSRITGIVLSAQGLYVLDAATSRVLLLARDRDQVSTVATIPDLSPCTLRIVGNAPCEPGVPDHLPQLTAAALDAHGTLFVADGGQGIIWRVVGEKAEVWDSSLDFVAPTGTGLAGMQFDQDGQLVFAVTTTNVALTGAVYVTRVTADGSPGARQELWRSQAQEGPAGLSLGVSGRVYLTLLGSTQLLVLEANGTERERVGSELFSSLSAITFRGQSVLVTNQPPMNTSAPAVLRVSVTEPGIQTQVAQ